jgi:hypothetical protein
VRPAGRITEELIEQESEREGNQGFEHGATTEKVAGAWFLSSGMERLDEAEVGHAPGDVSRSLAIIYLSRCRRPRQ